MKTKQILLPVACVIAAFGLLSCEKEAAVEPTTPVMAKADVSLKDGILVFKDRATMRLYNATLNAKGIAYADEWEKSLHFESMAHILNQVTEAESKLEKDFLLGKSADELKRLPKELSTNKSLKKDD